jgi:hypothetical protein
MRATKATTLLSSAQTTISMINSAFFGRNVILPNPRRGVGLFMLSCCSCSHSGFCLLLRSSVCLSFACVRSLPLPLALSPCSKERATPRSVPREPLLPGACHTLGCAEGTDAPQACGRKCVPHGQTESGGIVLLTYAGPRAPRGGVTRQGVVLTDLQSLVDVNKLLSLSLSLCPSLPPPLSVSLPRARALSLSHQNKKKKVLNKI